MLVLTRCIGEEIVIGDDIHVKVVAVKGDKVRLGIAAPDNVRIDRLEVHQRRQEFSDAPKALEVTPAHN
jgi:carbon storage regulator